MASLILLLSSACTTWNEAADTIAYECFEDRKAANAFAHYGMEQLIRFREATGVGNGKKGLAIWVVGANPCEPGNAARLADDRSAFTPEEEALFRDAFHHAAQRFRQAPGAIR